MVKDCIKIALENDASTRIKLTRLCYHQLARYKIYSVYKLCGISHVAGMNIYNVTISNCQKARQYDLSKSANYREHRTIMRSLKRNDVRIRMKFYSKYGQCRRNRADQLLHHVSKHIVRKAR
jgi:hypothetical protein